MSFRRRGEIVSGRERTPGVPVPNVANPMLNRSAVNRSVRGPPVSVGSKPPVTKNTEVKEEFSHPGVKPSIVLSHLPCMSTGTKDIDTILVHGGIPMDNMILIEEDGSTDFSGVLVKYFVSEGIIQNRLVGNGKILNHCIVIGMDSIYGNELYNIYAGNSKERKKKLVKEQEGKLSVSNINANNELKIAWRYKKELQNNNLKEIDNDNSKYPDYCHQFDITTNIRPSPGSPEISYISLDDGYDNILKQVNKIVENQLKNSKDNNKLIRIAIPYLLNPMIYGCSDELINLSNVFRFLFGLKKIMNTYSGRITMMSSISSELYDDSNGLLDILESMLFDGVLRLVPFPHELNVLMEKVYKTQREKIKQGYVDILRLPVLTSMGMMDKRLKEYCFKNSKSNFHVEQWSIPVEEEEIVEKTDF